MAEKSGKGSSATLAFLIGAGAGLAAGMLLAPRAGRETRMQLKERARTARNKFEEGVRKEKDMAGDIVDTAKQAVEDTKAVVQDAKASARRRVEQRETAREG